MKTAIFACGRATRAGQSLLASVGLALACSAAPAAAQDLPKGGFTCPGGPSYIQRTELRKDAAGKPVYQWSCKRREVPIPNLPQCKAGYTGKLFLKKKPNGEDYYIARCMPV